MSDAEKLALVLSLANQIGGAYRGDWSDFDGRTLRDQMDELAGVAAGKITVERYRAMNHLCPRGGGHFEDYCDSGCEAEA